MLTMDKQLGKNKSPPYGWSKTQYYAQFVVAADAGSVEAMQHLVSHGSDKTKLYVKQLIERYPYVSRSMLHELDPYEEDLVRQKEPPSGYEEILEYIEERRPFFAWHFDEHRVALKDDVSQKRAALEDEVSLVMDEHEGVVRDETIRTEKRTSQKEPKMERLDRSKRRVSLSSTKRTDNKESQA